MNCPKCGNEIDGAGSYCKKCFSEYIKERRKKNPERERRVSKIYRSRYDKKFRKERREEYNAKKRKYYNPQREKEAYQKRKEWLLSGDVTQIDLIEIYRRDKGECVYCGAPVKPRLYPHSPRGFDHVISRINGGKHTKENLVVCCRKCNELKGGE